MKKEIPTWAVRKAGAHDQPDAREAHGRGAMQVRWPDRKALRLWAKEHGWPTPWLGFDQAFLARMLESEASFALAVNESGIEVHIPKREHKIPAGELRELDALYDERSEGRPTSWGSLVEGLRDIRRAVEAGVVVTVEGGETLRSWQDFYAWAHGRYHMLEDGYDKWIGNDDP